MVNGPGVRASLFLAGCSHGCKGCHNKGSWNPRAGHHFSDALQEQMVKDLQDEEIGLQGLSLSGGDPLHKANRKGVSALLEALKQEVRRKYDVWLWTGYNPDSLLSLARVDESVYSILRNVDTIVPSPFVEELKVKHPLYGSSNQDVYKVDWVETAEEAICRLHPEKGVGVVEATYPRKK